MAEQDDSKPPMLKARRKNANMKRENARSIAQLIPNPPGKSLNPFGWGGKPYQELVRICRELTPNAMEVIMHALEQKQSMPKLALDAAKFVIERGWGKTPLEVKLAYEDKYRQMSDQELDTKIREIMNNAGVVNAIEELQGDSAVAHNRPTANGEELPGRGGERDGGEDTGPSGGVRQ